MLWIVLFVAIVVVVDETLLMVVMVMIMVMVILTCNPTNFLFPGLLTKTMSNRTQDFYLSRVLMPY